MGSKWRRKNANENDQWIFTKSAAEILKAMIGLGNISRVTRNSASQSVGKRYAISLQRDQVLYRSLTMMREYVITIAMCHIRKASWEIMHVDVAILSCCHLIILQLFTNEIPTIFFPDFSLHHFTFYIWTCNFWPVDSFRVTFSVRSFN